MTRDTEARERVVAKLRGAFAEGKEFPNARGRVSRLDMGPPVGFPVQFRVVGPDPPTARKIAEEIRDVVRRHPHTRDTEIDWGETAPVGAAEGGPGPGPGAGADAAGRVRDAAVAADRGDGDAVPRGDRADRRGRPGRAGRAAGPRQPAGRQPAVAGRGAGPAGAGRDRVGPSSRSPILRRWNREPTVIVRADVADGVQPPDVTADLLPQLQAIRDRLPPGYRIETGGSAEESGKANVSLFAVLPVMVLAMLTLLMVQLQDFRKAAPGVR